MDRTSSYVVEQATGLGRGTLVFLITGGIPWGSKEASWRFPFVYQDRPFVFKLIIFHEKINSIYHSLQASTSQFPLPFVFALVFSCRASAPEALPSRSPIPTKQRWTGKTPNNTPASQRNREELMRSHCVLLLADMLK